MPSSASLDRDPLAVVVSIEHAAQVTDVDLELAGELQRSTILDRTARGVDVDGTPFAPYAKPYAKTRTKSGRKASPVDLLWSGKMLQSLRVVVNKALNEVALVIYGEESVRAGAHNNGVPGKLPQRRWLGANEADAGRIAKLLERLVSKRVGALK
jgi:hypothetical protein